jgi:hypothetical protein
MIAFAFLPIGEPLATASRRMSPVEICGIWNFSTRRLACVPFPEPGGPIRIKFSSRLIAHPARASGDERVVVVATRCASTWPTVSIATPTTIRSAVPPKMNGTANWDWSMLGSTQIAAR